MRSDRPGPGPKLPAEHLEGVGLVVDDDESGLRHRSASYPEA